jgi:tetratricopeptide (TPR) repeat protein
MSVRGEIHVNTTGDARILPLDSPRFTIGRGTENSLPIPATVVSRSHAEIIRVGNDYILRDLGSTNGCYVNGTRVSEQMLTDGDRIRFGANGPEVAFRLIEEESGGIVIQPPQRNHESLIHSLTGRLKTPQNNVCEEANLRMVLAEAHLNKGDYDKAAEILGKYNDTTVLVSLPIEFRASVLLAVGRVYLERKDLELAADALQRALNFFAQASGGKGDDTGLSGTHSALGRAMISTGNLLAARDHLNRAMLCARRAGNVKLRAETHYLVGKVDWKEGDFEGARYNWSRAARMAEETSDDLLRVRVQLQQALIVYTEANLKEAVTAYQNAIQQIEKLGNPRLLLKAYNNFSRVLSRQGAWAAAEKLAADRLRLASEHRIPKAEALALTDLAELKLLHGDVNAAEQNIELALERLSPIEYARTCRIRGRILQARHQPAAAIESFERGLAEARQNRAIEEQVLLGLELALAYLDAGDLAKAREELNHAETATTLDPALNLMARALYTHGAIHAKAGQLNEANRFFGQSLSIFQTIGDPFRTAMCQATIGALRLLQNRPESARAHLEEASRMFAKLGAMGELRRVEARLQTPTLSNVSAAMTTTLAAVGGTAQLSMAHLGMTGNLPTATLPSAHHILIAVSSDELATVLERGLEVENYLVDRAMNGREAIEFALKNQQQDYHLLILDALLEFKSGFDICRELRKNKRDTPVVLLGGRQGLEDKIEALQSGADDFLSKRNFVFEELLAKVEALLR